MSDKFSELRRKEIRENSEQHRPIVKLQFNQENTNSESQNQQQSANHNSQENNNGTH
jgi:hypothetical protein